MRATLSAPDNNRVTLTVEVDEADMATAMDAAVKVLAQQVNVKGFRKGKVPKQVLLANIGGAAVLRSEAIRQSLPDFYAKGVSEALIDPINQPEINIVSGEDDGVLVFNAEVEVRPTVELTDYRSLRVTIPSPVVTDDEIEAQINRFRETDATLEDVDRPIVTGDLVSMDISAAQVGSDAEPFSMSDFMYTVGSGSIAPEVDQLILGLRAGEDLTVTADAGDGSNVVYEMHLKQVKERILPDLTDEWVEENTEWPTIAAMRDAVLSQMGKMRIAEAQMSQRDATLAALSDLVSIDSVPGALVDAEANDRLHDFGHRLSQQGMGLEQYLQATGQTPEALLAAIREDATRGVKIDLALRAVARSEGLEPTAQEITDELEKTAETMAADAETLRQNLYESGRTYSFFAEVAKMKASKWLYENVTYVDALGLVIDRSLLAADQSDGDDA